MPWNYVQLDDDANRVAKEGHRRSSNCTRGKFIITDFARRRHVDR